MKKLSIYLSVMAIAFAFSFISCDKDVESTALILEVNDSAIIKLYVYAELDNNTAGPEIVPSNITTISVSIPYADFRPLQSGTWENTFEVIDGMATIIVPTDDDGVNVSISAAPFEFEQIQGFGQDDVDTQIKKLYESGSIVVNVISGETEIEQLSYNAPQDFNNFIKKIQLTGTVVAEMDNSNLEPEEISQNITLTFHGDGWNTSITTSGANFTVEVPASVDVYITGTFVASNLIPTATEYEYTLNGSLLGNFLSSDQEFIIDFGNGQPVE